MFLLSPLKSGLKIAIPWRETLETLRTQFQSRAAQSSGIYHLMVEVADHERDKMQGPDWFKPFSTNVKIVDGKINYQNWECSRTTGLPSVPPGFREPLPNEVFTDEDRVVRDKLGVVRAVATLMKLRRSYFCGAPSEDVAKFEALANIAAIALAGADDLSEHFFANEMIDIFRHPRGGIRYIFGDVPWGPEDFISSGWDAGVLQFDNGVLIDLPISESRPDSSHWVYLLHRLGWHRAKGSGLTAHRATWKKNSEVAWDMLGVDWSAYPDNFSKQFEGFSRTAFYSVLGTKESPLDLNLASVFAIQLLLAPLETKSPPTSTKKSHSADYSKESWKQRPILTFKSVGMDEGSRIQPTVGIVIATEVERMAVLRHLKPPTNYNVGLQVFNGNNTYYLGRLGATNVVAVMTSSMGSIGRDSSTIVTTELLDLWNVPAVIMVGIAFGKDSEKQMIGGVLISEKIISYEPERLGKSVNEERGDSPRAGALLLNRFKNLLGWKFANPEGLQCSYQIGSLLSGEKLVDDPNEKGALFKRFPGAIGGEMEGAGFSAAAERKKREWIVVKAICDWGDGNKNKDHQEFAATASVSLVEHVLNQSGVLQGLVELLPSASDQQIGESQNVHAYPQSSNKDAKNLRPVDIKRFQSSITGHWLLQFKENGIEKLEMDIVGNHYCITHPAVRPQRPNYRIEIKELDVDKGRVVWDKIDAKTNAVRQTEELEFQPGLPIQELFGNQQGNADHVLIYKRRTK